MHRIAKVIAARGYCSRREAEKLIFNNQVTIGDKIINDPATLVALDESIYIKNILLPQKEPRRVWLLHKPKGYITSNYDPQGRQTIFDLLPKTMPRVVSVGRLDYNTEGLLILTNDGEYARLMELPSSKINRTYHCFVRGTFTKAMQQKMSQGCEVKGITYGPIQAKLIAKENGVSEIRVTLQEGKNREIRKVFAFFDMIVVRLVRLEYGPYKLMSLRPGVVIEVPELVYSY